MLSTWFDSVVPFVGLLVALVVAHELGHFVVAKLAGVKVLEFGLGFPPKLWGKKFGETEYTINALPLGGFVRLLGETDAEEADPTEDGAAPAPMMDTRAAAKSGAINPRALAAKPRWIRILVLSAGVFVNALLPVAFFSVDYMIPQHLPDNKAVIARVSAGTPAEKAGLKPKDLILTIDGHTIHNTDDVSRYITLYQGTTMHWQVRRAGQVVDVYPYARWAVPTEVEADGTKVRQGPTGIVIDPLSTFPQTYTQQYAPWEAVPRGAQETWDTLVIFRNQIVSWVQSRTAPQVAGPVGIAQATGQVVQQSGWEALLRLAALLSLNLAIVNILPLPMLDGGRVLFVLIEIARGGKRIAPEKEALVHLVGFALMMSFVVFISYIDIARIVSGGSLGR
jgi:regulator of sigma E protease